MGILPGKESANYFFKYRGNNCWCPISAPGGGNRSRAHGEPDVRGVPPRGLVHLLPIRQRREADQRQRTMHTCAKHRHRQDLPGALVLVRAGDRQ